MNVSLECSRIHTRYICIKLTGIGGVQIKYQTDFYIPPFVRMMGNLVSAHWKENKLPYIFPLLLQKKTSIF